MISFWEKVRDRLKQLERSRPWLSRHSGVPLNTINSWMAKDRPPRVYEATSIAKALETTVEFLVSGSDPTFKQIRPDIEMICNILGQLSLDQVAEIRGYISRYLEEQQLGRADSGRAHRKTG